MIRAACHDDIPQLVEMGRRFRHAAYRRHLAENPEQMRRLAAQLIDADSLIVAERNGEITGMLGWVVFPHFLSGERVAGEVFWWVEPQHRGEGLKLLREAEKRARVAGAMRMQMIAPDDRVAGIYRRLGYEFVEAAYQRSLNAI